MISDNMSDTKISILNTIFNLQLRFEVKAVQPKDIINYSSLSHQTIFACLQELVQEDFLNKRCKGKFKYYGLTKKGKNILVKARENRHNSLTEPLIQSMANQLIEEHPEEFKNISYNIIADYLRKQVKDLEDSTISTALNYFAKFREHR